MTSEQINEMNENESQKRVKGFLDAIRLNGYKPANYTKLDTLCEHIARGDDSPISKFNNLRSFEENIAWGEKEAFDFREEMLVSLNSLKSLVPIDGAANLTDREDIKSRGIDQEEIIYTKNFHGLIDALKQKLGIVQDFDRVKRAMDACENTKRKIAELDSNNSLSEEQKEVEFARLQNIYWGSNVKALNAAKNISGRAEASVADKILDISFINEIATNLNEISAITNVMNLSDDVKLLLIKDYRHISDAINDHRTVVIKYNTAKRNYATTLSELGLKASHGAPAKTQENNQTLNNNEPEGPTPPAAPAEPTASAPTGPETPAEPITPAPIEPTQTEPLDIEQPFAPEPAPISPDELPLGGTPAGEPAPTGPEAPTNNGTGPRGIEMVAYTRTQKFKKVAKYGILGMLILILGPIDAILFSALLYGLAALFGKTESLPSELKHLRNFWFNFWPKLKAKIPGKKLKMAQEKIAELEEAISKFEAAAAEKLSETPNLNTENEQEMEMGL